MRLRLLWRRLFQKEDVVETEPLNLPDWCAVKWRLNGTLQRVEW